ncbi:hypothetical protein JL721_9466 [Aureococcus anophagefferens]|nr:hypothetical protein JL721_9466 [Aureococcus anophagefferens]
MPTFKLRNCDNLEIPNEAHEAFEQFVICWLFNEVVPLYCHAPNRREATDDGPVPGARRRSPPPGLERLRVLELGGGIGAVSTMIQQMIEMLDPGAPTSSSSPTAPWPTGPGAQPRPLRSTFAVLRGVLSDKDAVPFGSGDVDPNHPRAWIWHEDDWPDGEVEWYPGLVSEAKEDGTYAILFDDEDERYGVPRDELRPIFVAGSFDWTHPFVQPDAAETQSSVDDRANSPAPEAIPEES